MPKLFRRKDIILFLLLVATLHILLTYLVSSHVGRELGTQTAGIISSSLQKEELSEKEFQDIPSKLEEKSKVYRNILFFLSLPFDPILQPINQRWVVRPILDGKIQVDEYKFRASLIGTTTRVLNSIVFSLLVYWCFRTVRQRMKQNRMNKNT
jgi:hypothetical protein